ncbi:MAG: hypothetical protein GXO92_06155 [FCB group bacterium]|nr:hypothetical protein [FCB group bacterium]
MNKLFNKLFVAVYSVPGVKERWARAYQALEFNTIPWTPLAKPLSQCRIALLTTGGVHLKTDIPFNMDDTNGDPTYRIIPSATKPCELMTTHDYYDHRDADRDINLVFPIEILQACVQEGLVGESADSFYSFMGHVKGPHLRTLIKKTSREVAARMKQEGVDVAVLVPS